MSALGWHVLVDIVMLGGFGLWCTWQMGRIYIRIAETVRDEVDARLERYFQETTEG